MVRSSRRAASRNTAAVLVAGLGLLGALCLTVDTANAADANPHKPPLVAKQGAVSSPAKPEIDPARDILSASFRLDIVTGRATADVTLAATASQANTSDLWLLWGVQVGDVCSIDSDEAVVAVTHEDRGGNYDSGSGWRREGSTIRLAKTFRWDFETFTCAVATTMPSFADGPDAAVAYDTAISALHDVFAAPEGRPEATLVAGGDVAYRGVWTPLRVRVTNAGTGPAAGIVLLLAGRGVQSRPVRVGALAAGKSKVVTARVRARGGGKRRNLTALLTGRGPEQFRRQSVFPVNVFPRGTRPLPGRYVGNGGRVSFRVNRAGRVANFRIRVVGACNPGAYTWAEWKTLPPARANRYGWLDRHFRTGKDLSEAQVHMRVRFAGRRALDGHYDYRSGLCSAEESFSARRVGR